MKKVISILLLVALTLGTVSAVYAGSNYSDVKSSNWAYKYVNPLSEKGIVKGYGDGQFRPNNTVSYGEFIKMALVTATNEDVGNSKTGHWATNYYNKALELNYFGETDIKIAQLKNSIPRYDMALIISNILGKTQIDNYKDLEKKLGDIDSEVRNDYDIIKCYFEGIITGYPDDTFKPENTLTRAESATVIYRLIDEDSRIKPKLDSDEIVNDKKEGVLADIVDIDTIDISFTKQTVIPEKYEVVTNEDIGVRDLRTAENLFAFYHDYTALWYMVKDGVVVESCNAIGVFNHDAEFQGYYFTTGHRDVKDYDFFVIITTQTKYYGEKVDAKILYNEFR